MCNCVLVLFMLRVACVAVCVVDPFVLCCVCVPCVVFVGVGVGVL